MEIKYLFKPGELIYFFYRKRIHKAIINKVSLHSANQTLDRYSVNKNTINIKTDDPKYSVRITDGKEQGNGGIETIELSDEQLSSTLEELVERRVYNKSGRPKDDNPLIFNTKYNIGDTVYICENGIIEGLIVTTHVEKSIGKEIVSYCVHKVNTGEGKWLDEKDIFQSIEDAVTFLENNIVDDTENVNNS